jgi:hypothetical protein
MQCLRITESHFDAHQAELSSIICTFTLDLNDPTTIVY